MDPIQHRLPIGSVQIPTLNSSAIHIRFGPLHLVPAPFYQLLIQSQFSQFGGTPGENAFAANAIPELSFALDHEDARSSLCHRSGESSSAESAAYHDQVVIRARHFEFRSLRLIYRFALSLALWSSGFSRVWKI
jgi:hypothetical protein